MTDKSDLSPTWPTIFELGSTIPQIDLNRLGRPAGGRKNAPPITKGLIPEPFPAKEGYFEATPAQLASLRVPKIEVGSDIKGFQREKINQHVRKIAAALHSGEEVPPLILSIFPDGLVYVDDGQHRALAALVVRKPLEVVVKRRTVEQARKLFTSQGKAKNIRTDDTLLTGDSALELYIQDALTSTNHPWSDLVTLNRNTSTRMTPTTMGNMIGAFVFNTFNQGVTFYTTRNDHDFDPKKADLLAELVRVFGTHATNPFAFRGRVLRTISYAATHVFWRNPASQYEKDVIRWKKHMPQFDFAKYPHLFNRESELTLVLVEHWNKRLPVERRVKPYTYA